MKKILFVITMIISMSSFAQEKMTGVIRQVACNAPSGLGYIKLEIKEGKTIKVVGLRVNSYDLCGAAPDAFSKLSSIGYDAVLSGLNSMFEVFITNNYVTSIDKIRDFSFEEYDKYMKGVEDYKQVGVVDVFAWFNMGPVFIHHRQKNIDELVKKYTQE